MEGSVVESLSVVESVLPDLIRLAQIKQRLAGFWYQVTYAPRVVITDEITKAGYVAKISDGPEYFLGAVFETEAEALEDALERWEAAQNDR